MPEEAVRAKAKEVWHNKRTNDKTEVLAGIFRVSVSAMSVRLRELRIDATRSGKIIAMQQSRGHWERYAKELLESR